MPRLRRSISVARAPPTHWHLPAAQGRIVVPAGLRQALGLAQGEVMVARVDGERLVPERRAAVLARLQERFAAVPGDVGLADALIAERRVEARREEEM